MICIIISFTGCSNNKNNNIDIKIPDVEIEQENRTYIANKDGVVFRSSDAILICGYNEYQCVNTSLKYDEQSESYICVVEFKKIINNQY